MLSHRTSLPALLAVTGALLAGAQTAAVAAPAHSSTTASVRLEFVPDAICGDTIGDQGQGQTGGNDTIVCGSGVMTVAPSTAITTTVGPAVSAAAAGGLVITTTGNVAIAL
jgi:hypothetical protein